MLTTAALLVGLVQAGSAGPPHKDAPAAHCISCIEDNVETTVSQPRPEQIEEREFLSRLNKLVTALRVFSNNYNSRGTIDVKQVRDIQKAIRELQKSEWFRQTNNRRGSR